MFFRSGKAAATASVLFQQLVGLTTHATRHQVLCPGFGQHQPGIFRSLKEMIRHMIKYHFTIGFPWFIRSPTARNGAFGGEKYHKTHIIYMYWYSTIGYILRQSFEHRFDRKLSEKKAPPILLYVNLDNSSVRDFLFHLTSPHFSCTPSTWRAQTWLLYPWGRRLGAVWNLFVLLGVERYQLNSFETKFECRPGSCVTELLNTQVFLGLFSGSCWRFLGFR